MISSTLPTTILALCFLILSPSPVLSQQPQRELSGDLIGVLQGDSEVGGIGNLIYNFHSNSAKEEDVTRSRIGDEIAVVGGGQPTLRDAVNSAAESRLRGATDFHGPSHGAWRNKLGKAEKKDCQKYYNRKSHKSKGSKGSKGIRRPNNTPSASPSASPTESPSHSMSPTEEWCHEEYYMRHYNEPSAEPTVSSAPTVSVAPSPSPSVSNAPTISNAPTVSPEPTNPPSVSADPTSSQSPTTPPTVTPPTPPTSPKTPAPVSSAESEAMCEVFPASYSVNEDNKQIISFWSEANAQGRESNGSAALSRAVASPLDRSDTEEFKVGVELKIDTAAAEGDAKADADGNGEFGPSDVGLHLDKIVTAPVALYVVGCKTKSLKTAESYYWRNKNSRALVEDETGSSDFAALRDWSCDYSVSKKESCDASGMCSMKCFTSLNYVGDVPAADVQEKLEWSMREYFSMMDDVTSWYPMQQITTIEVEEVDTSDVSVDAATDTEMRQSKQMKAGPFIGAATGLLALLLLLVLFVRRRKRNEIEQVSHLKLDESADDDTFYNGSDGNSLEGLARHEYNTRDIHIVGEGDSVISHWTGYTGNNRNPYKENDYEVQYNSALVNGIATDVHQCSSATCEICAKNRQAGLNFVSTGANCIEAPPLRSRSLPSDASREYSAEDTVEL